MDPIAVQALSWLIILIILVIIELATFGLTTIWFAGGALVALIAALLQAPIWLQVVLFLAVSVILLIFTRPALIKLVGKNKVKTNVDSLIGKEVVVSKDIENLKNEGQVLINGLEWTARTRENGSRIQKGEIVNIIAIEGVKAIVERTGKREE